jgi:S-(hydroxymethyl)glutathione dehydrogenase / alcohol dehydrogenase
VRSDFARMLNLWRNGRLDLEGMVTKKIAIDEVNEAVADLKAGTVIRSVITF